MTHSCVSSSQQKLGSCHSSSETGQLCIIHFIRLPVKQTITGYLWDRPSSSQSGLRAGQRKLLQQTHHWSRKNWQRWLCTMCCQLKTTGWRQKRRINQCQSGLPIGGGGWHTFRKIKTCLSLLSIPFSQSSDTETNAVFQTLWMGSNQIRSSPKSSIVFHSELKNRSLAGYCNFAAFFPFSPCYCLFLT